MSYDDPMTTNMELTWDGYVNARDLGGLPTSLSRTGTTVPGRIASPGVSWGSNVIK